MEHFFTILGGMGTQATESFVHLLNRRTLAHKDQDYLNYVVFNHATVPDRTAYILNKSSDNPLPYLLDDIEKQNALKPDFIVLACNTAHYFYDELTAHTDIPLLHMPRLAAETAAADPEVHSVAFLGTAGTRQAGIYDEALRGAGLTPVYPDDALQARVNALIYDQIKAQNDLTPAPFLAILEDALAQTQADALLLGCTELSLIADHTPEIPYKVFDAQSILVDRTIATAMHNTYNGEN